MKSQDGVLTRLGRLALLFCLSWFGWPAAQGAQIAAGAKTDFRWIQAASDPKLWQQILLAFHDELAPDEAKPGQEAPDVYLHKYLQKVGVINHSALVIVGHRPAQAPPKGNSWDEYHTAFTFDLSTGKKAEIDGADQMWQWELVKLAKFGPGNAPDVTFTYLTCTECEPDVMFNSFRYDESKSSWELRSWGDGKNASWAASAGLVVNMDPVGSDILSFDCIYRIMDLNDDGFQDLFIRCKGITETKKGAAKVEDASLLYTLADGQFKARLIADRSEVVALTSRVCRPTVHSLLCVLPGYLAAPAHPSALLDQMFPGARAASRNLKTFRGLTQAMTMQQVVAQCGTPDEVTGGGHQVFIYHLDDGSAVAIGSTGAAAPLLYAIHFTDTGKAFELFPAKPSR